MTPKTGYFLDDDLGIAWDGRTIAINAETRPEKCLGYTHKTLEFTSDTNGTLTILEDLVGDGDFQTYTTQAIIATVTVPLPITGDMAHIKLSFSVAAIVTAKFNFQK